jgi:hypothetical protein
VLTGEALAGRGEAIQQAPDLAGLARRLATRAALITARGPVVPDLKGMLTADGGFCPVDRTPLVFDPWSPQAHRCPRCGQVARGARHDRRWAWLQHLWLGERIAELATVGTLTGDPEPLAWVRSTLREYGRRYAEFPNADNVLGPSHLFSSTYLESVWLVNYLAGATLLREAGELDDELVAAVGSVAEEAAGLIGEFEEGLSNRQTWHNAALVAVAVWFEDPDLAARALEAPRGLVGHLVDGFQPDGMWYEGENYHLFALRGMLVGAEWARLAGVELFDEPAGRARLIAALRAPLLSMLPDGSFPARKDSRFGVSLAQPMYLELWERGAAILAGLGEDQAVAELAGALRYLYDLPAPEAQLFDSYLHEAGEPSPSRRSRADLSWWMLLQMLPELPPAPAAVPGGSVMLPAQGLAILRHPGRYVSVEGGAYGGGHGHPDRLHLTLHADRVHWLADPGTGSYVSPDLFWYRSTLAHNAPRVDGHSQRMGDAAIEAFDAAEGWGWVRTRFDGFSRTVVSGPGHLVDVMEFQAEQPHLVELPWHPDGELEVATPGRWEPEAFDDPHADHAERFLAQSPQPFRWHSTVGDRRLTGVFDGSGDLLRLRGPDRPGRDGRPRFLLRRGQGNYVGFRSVLGFDGVILREVRFAASEVVVETGAGTVIHRQTSDGWDIEAGDRRVQLRGLIRDRLPAALALPVVGSELLRYQPPEAEVPHLAAPPALDGSLDGFPDQYQLMLDHEDQYRRTELPYPGPEGFAATAHLGWDEGALYVAVSVVKQELVLPSAGSAPKRLDNEPDLIHADGLQLYMQLEGHRPHGWLVAPDPSSSHLQIVPIGPSGAPALGSWAKTPEGYRITVALTVPGWPPGVSDPPRFDLIVNEMASGRERRLGQLVWSGGGGWAYLRGDRQDPGRFGRLVLR